MNLPAIDNRPPHAWLTKITRPNGTVRQMDYDAAGQLTNIVEKLGSGTPIAVFKLRWDDAGRITNEFRAPLPHSWSAPARTQVFDNDNRVTSFNSTTLTNDADEYLTKLCCAASGAAPFATRD